MFEVVLAGHPLLGRRRVAAPVAIAVHAAVLGGVLAVSAWKIGDVAEPNVPIVFAAPAELPAPAGAPGAERHPPVRHPSPPAQPAPVAALPSIPAVLPAITIPTVDPPTLPGSAAGDGESHEGAPGGVAGAEGAGEREGFGPGGVLSARAPNVVAPRLLQEVQPEYPEAARRARRQGAVILQAVIGTGGDVEDVQVLSSASALFDEPATRAVRQWRYTAATLDRRAVRVAMTVTVFFTLH
jgi:protein TonB